MIDFLMGAIVGALAVYAILHFKGETPQKAMSDFTNLEQRIKQMIADALNDLKAAADAHEAKAVADAVANAVQPAVDAAKAEDEQAVRDFTAANFPAP